MKEVLIALLVIIISIIILLGLCALSACFFWGLGLLIINVFGITYTWTFWHGLCVAIVVSVLSSIFSKGK